NNLDFSEVDKFLVPIKTFLRTNANILKEKFDQNKMTSIWYQPMSAFYYVVDFSQLPIMEKFKKNENDTTDYSLKICKKLLDDTGVAVVPGSDFGITNSMRISLLLEKEAFSEAMDKLISFLN
ncbi:MAG: aminotransferase class I/II-fold pyridoxal phosphate-dependent enzyme, partial [Halobacteriovoraceae bacterium]|nr:aminotransferase class I/II-fold pyridoxal phosphate-dependent enzyme [Halobacteriovoraceae bacterium]